MVILMYGSVRMKRTITATELKNSLGKYLDFVAENNEVVVTKMGKRLCDLARTLPIMIAISCLGSRQLITGLTA